MNPTLLTTASLPPCPHPPPPPAIPPLPLCCRALSTLLIAQGTFMDQHVAMTPSPSLSGECCSHLRKPCRGTGPWCQERHCNHRNVSVSTPAAGGRPSFASQAIGASCRCMLGNGNDSTATFIYCPCHLRCVEVCATVIILITKYGWGW